MAHGMYDTTTRPAAGRRGRRRPTRPAAEEPARAGASRRAPASAGLEDRGRVVGAGRRGQRPEPDRPANQNSADHDASRGRGARATCSGVTASGPSAIDAFEPTRGRSAAKNTSAPSGDRGQRRRAAAPRRSRRSGGRRPSTTPIRVSADHDQRKVGCRGPAPSGHADRDVAEHGRDPDQAQDREHPAERAADQDEQDQRADRVRRDPLRGQGQAEQQPDDRHRQPERQPARATSPSRARRTACRRR